MVTKKVNNDSKYEVKWDQANQRWRKQYGKKIYTWNPKTNGYPPDPVKSRRAAEKWWKDKKEEIDKLDKIAWQARNNLEEYEKNIKENSYPLDSTKV